MTARDLFAAQPERLAPDGEKGQQERGAYFTPDALALAICRSLHALAVRPVSIFEPGCGGGAFLRAAAATWPDIELVGVDLVPACTGPGRVMQGDLFDVHARFDLVLGNPDFAIAERVVRHGLSLLNPGGHLAFLLRLAFLGGQGRAQLYREHPLRYLQPIAGRPSFTADGRTDPIEYGLFVWQRAWVGRGELAEPLEWKR